MRNGIGSGINSIPEKSRIVTSIPILESTLSDSRMDSPKPYASIKDFVPSMASLSEGKCA